MLHRLVNTAKNHQSGGGSDQQKAIDPKKQVFQLRDRLLRRTNLRQQRQACHLQKTKFSYLSESCYQSLQRRAAQEGKRTNPVLHDPVSCTKILVLTKMWHGASFFVLRSFLRSTAKLPPFCARTSQKCLARQTTATAKLFLLRRQFA